ncbi:MAG: hypothetical protein WC803_05190 [Sphingomonas sp.]|jgi:hypothetical protein
MRVGWQRRALAFVVAVLAASLSWVLMFMALALEQAGRDDFVDSVYGLASICLLVSPILVACVTLGCLLGLAVERMIPRRVGPVAFCALGAACSSALTVVLNGLVLQLPKDVMVAVPGVTGGLAAAAVWWNMVRVKERMANG